MTIYSGRIRGQRGLTHDAGLQAQTQRTGAGTVERISVEHQLQSGDRLPSERSLCEAWGLSRSALRSATARMEKDGVLCSRPGAGTYVAQRKYTRNLQGL